MIDPDAFELHTVNNWENSNAEEQMVIVRSNQERARKGVGYWNEWTAGLRRWADGNSATACIYFDDSKWCSNTNFRGFQFHTQVSFLRSRFVGDRARMEYVDFSNVVFHAEVGFVDATFTDVSVIFENTIFQGHTDFSHAAFKRRHLTFANAKFLGDLSFESAKCRDCTTSFAGVEFRGGAIFNYTAFSRSVDFSEAIFTGSQTLFEEIACDRLFANFAGAEFSARVNRFRHLKFSKVDFRRAAFARNVVFRDVRFQGRCDLENADFREVLNFINCTFELVPDFNFVTFKQPPHLATMCIPWLPIGNCDAPNTEAYRALKQMAKDVGDHHHELKYFAYEMHSKLYLDSTSKTHKVGIFMYRVLSDFGQSLARPLAWALLLFVFTAVIQWTALAERPSFPHIEDGWQLSCKRENEQMNPYSAIARERLNAALIFLPADKTEPARVSTCLYGDEGYKPFWFKVLNSLHSLLSAACLFLFGLGVRNRFKMK